MNFLRRGTKSSSSSAGEIQISTKVEGTTDMPQLLARLKTNSSFKASLVSSMTSSNCPVNATAPRLSAGEIVFRELRRSKEVELVVLPPNPEEKHGKLEMVVVEDHHITLEHITALLKQIAKGIFKPEQVDKKMQKYVRNTLSERTARKIVIFGKEDLEPV